jgi:hypothetical protein
MIRAEQQRWWNRQPDRAVTEKTSRFAYLGNILVHRSPQGRLSRETGSF